MRIIWGFIKLYLYNLFLFMNISGEYGDPTIAPSCATDKLTSTLSLKEASLVTSATKGFLFFEIIYLRRVMRNDLKSIVPPTTKGDEKILFIKKIENYFSNFLYFCSTLDS